jgi:hypothetical protein
LDAWAWEEVHGEIDPEEGWELDADGEELCSEHGDEVATEEEEELGAGATPGISEMPTNMQVGNLKVALNLHTPMGMWLVLLCCLHWMHGQGRRSTVGLILRRDGNWTLMEKSCTQSMGTKWLRRRMKSSVLVQHRELAKCPRTCSNV